MKKITSKLSKAMKRLITFIIYLVPGINAICQQQNVILVREEINLGSTTVEINNKKNIPIEIIPTNNSMLKIVFECDTSLIMPEGPADKLSSFRFDIRLVDGKTTIISNPFSPKGKIEAIPNISTPGPGDYVVVDGIKYYRNNPPKISALPTQSATNPFVNKATFYVPKGRKLQIINSRGEIVLAEDLIQADIEMSGGTLQIKSLQTLNLKSTFSDIQLGTISNATIEINGGQLYIEKVNELDIDSRYTQPRIKSAGTIKMISLADNFTIDEVESITGAKTYGSCIVGTLKRRVSFEKGKGMSLQIQNISPGAETVKISSSNDSLILPVWNLKNYSIQINAPGNSELWLTEAIRNGVSTTRQNTESSPVFFGNSGSVKFTSKVGDTNGKHTVFDIECLSCVIKFK